MAEVSHFANLRSAAQFTPWCLDIVEINEKKVRLAGWAIPLDRQIENTKFLINDREADKINVGVARPDIVTFFPYLDASGISGFSVEHTLREDADVLNISYASSGVFHPSSYYYPLKLDQYTILTNNTGPEQRVQYPPQSFSPAD